MKTITFKAPERLYAELEAAALAEGVSKSEMARRALKAWLSRSRGKRRPRAFDLVKDLSGSVKGPADLLTNPKYIGTFGK